MIVLETAQCWQAATRCLSTAHSWRKSSRVSAESPGMGPSLEAAKMAATINGGRLTTHSGKGRGLEMLKNMLLTDRILPIQLKNTITHNVVVCSQRLLTYQALHPLPIFAISSFASMRLDNHATDCQAGSQGQVTGTKLSDRTTRRVNAQVMFDLLESPMSPPTFVQRNHSTKAGF